MLNKRGFLFLYETSNNVPNGDPFTGEQRYDTATQKILVSDVRIKRFIRDKMIEKGNDAVYVQFDQIAANAIVSANTSSGKKGKKGDDKNSEITGAALSFRQHLLRNGLIGSITDDLTNFKKTKNEIRALMQQFIDVRLFGGLLTEAGHNVSLQGAVQFRMLSSSLNKVKLETLQNTSVFPSKISNSQGSIGTSSYVPYSLMPIVGWLDEETAEKNGVSAEDVDKMLISMWNGVNGKSRTLSGSVPLVVFEVVYKGTPYKYNPAKTVYSEIKNLDKLVSIKTNKKETDIRGREDYTIDFSKLLSVASSDTIESINFYTEVENTDIYRTLIAHPKFKFMDLGNDTEKSITSLLTQEALNA